MLPNATGRRGAAWQPPPEQVQVARLSLSADAVVCSDAGDGGWTLAFAGGRNLLFSEAGQAIHELSDLAAYVWRSVEQGLSATEMTAELIATGLAADRAQAAIAAALEDFRALRAIDTIPPVASAPRPERSARLTIILAGVTVQLHLSRSLVGDVEAMFGGLITDAPEADVILCASLAGDCVDVFSPGQPDWSCERAQFIPLLKAQLIECVLACGRYEVALHAAALVRGANAVLLVGSIGAGKTTLAIALQRAGYEVVADDVVLLDHEGLITGLAFPFAAKASSWSLLSQYWPGIVDGPSYRRPDGQTLCFVPFAALDDPRPRRIGVVVLLDRQEGARASVAELDPTAALGALIAEGATRDERLTASGFTALVATLRAARCCRLTYSDLIEAADAVRRLQA